jgi:5-methylcytosine-specific restriction endonuclease McrA
MKKLPKEVRLQKRAEGKYRYFNTEHGFVTAKIATLFTPSNCRRRGLWPTCSKEDIRKLFERHLKEHGPNCQYCGDPWTYIVRKIKVGQGHTPRGSTNIKNFSIDRLDNTKTYTLDNIVFCCFDCNDKKHNTTFELAEKILELRDLRKKELDMGIWS